MVETISPYTIQQALKKSPYTQGNTYTNMESNTNNNQLLKALSILLQLNVCEYEYGYVHELTSAQREHYKKVSDICLTPRKIISKILFINYCAF